MEKYLNISTGISGLLLRIGIILILGQTLFFKFSGSEESVWIFSQLNVEPWGRYLAGFMELGVCILLVFPKTAIWGALGNLGIMSGAILMHALILGWEVQNDRGLLAMLATLSSILSLAILWKSYSLNPKNFL
jgi:uncharacterized membrane protein YphA (DoxX/SURF4 family)